MSCLKVDIFFYDQYHHGYIVSNVCRAFFEKYICGTNGAQHFLPFYETYIEDPCGDITMWRACKRYSLFVIKYDAWRSNFVNKLFYLLTRDEYIRIDDNDNVTTLTMLQEESVVFTLIILLIYFFSVGGVMDVMLNVNMKNDWFYILAISGRKLEARRKFFRQDSLDNDGFLIKKLRKFSLMRYLRLVALIRKLERKMKLLMVFTFGRYQMK